MPANAKAERCVEERNRQKCDVQKRKRAFPETQRECCGEHLGDVCFRKACWRNTRPCVPTKCGTGSAISRESISSPTHAMNCIGPPEP